MSQIDPKTNKKLYNFIINETGLYTIYDSNENYEDLLCDVCLYINKKNDPVNTIIKLNSIKFYKHIKSILFNNQKICIQDSHINLLFALKSFNILELLILENLSECKELLLYTFVENKMYDKITIIMNTGIFNEEYLNKIICNVEIFYKNPIPILIIIQYSKISEINILHILEYLIHLYNIFKSYDQNMIKHIKRNKKISKMKYNMEKYKIENKNKNQKNQKTTNTSNNNVTTPGNPYSKHELYYDYIKLDSDKEFCNYFISVIKKIYDNNLTLFIKRFISDFRYNINVNFINYCIFYFSIFEDNVEQLFDSLDEFGKINMHTSYNLYIECVKNIKNFKNLKKIFHKYYNQRNDYIMFILLDHPLMTQLKNYLLNICKNKFYFPISSNKIMYDTRLFNVIQS